MSAQSFSDKLLQDLKRYDKHKRRMALTKKIRNFSSAIGHEPSEWSALHVMEFMHEWESEQDKLMKVKTVLDRFNAIEAVFEQENWPKNFKLGSNFSDLKVMYMKNFDHQERSVSITPG